MEGWAKILIVDDEPFNVDYLEQELEYLDYETISAANGREALERVASCTFIRYHDARDGWFSGTRASKSQQDLARYSSHHNFCVGRYR